MHYTRCFFRLFPILTLLAALTLAPLAASQAHAAKAPDEVLKTAVNKVIEILSDPSLKGEENYAKQREALRETIGSFFDFQELSMRALGRFWRSFDDQQRQDFTNAFADLLEATYIDKLRNYSDEEVVITTVREGARGNVEVQTNVLTGGKKIPIFYRMVEKDEGWMVYDVIVEGVSLVKNYRTQFQEMMVNGSPEELIAKVRERANQKQESDKMTE